MNHLILISRLQIPPIRVALPQVQPQGRRKYLLWCLLGQATQAPPLGVWPTSLLSNKVGGALSSILWPLPLEQVNTTNLQLLEQLIHMLMGLEIRDQHCQVLVSITNFLDWMAILLQVNTVIFKTCKFYVKSLQQWYNVTWLKNNF